MLKLKLQYFGHLMQRTGSLEKTLMLGKIEGRRRRGRLGWDGWMTSLTQWTWVWHESIDMSLLPGIGNRQGSLSCSNPWGCKKSTQLINWIERYLFFLSTQAQSLLKLTSIMSVMPSNYLNLCYPLLLLLSVFTSIRVFSNEPFLCIRWPKYWSLARLKAGGGGIDRGWDYWMASPTWWTWIWASFGSWWWTGNPGMLQSMGSQRVGHDRVTKLKWTETLTTHLTLRNGNVLLLRKKSLYKS